MKQIATVGEPAKGSEWWLVRKDDPDTLIEEVYSVLDVNDEVLTIVCMKGRKYVEKSEYMVVEDE